MSDKLKPCPCCGADAETREFPCHGVNDQGGEVYCTECCMASENYGLAGQPHSGLDYATMCWNSRADADLTAKLEAATEANARIVRGQFAQICSACGYEVPAGESSWETLQAHVETCEKHPVYKLIAENKRLREALEWVVKDMCYKAPEQLCPALIERWYNHLQQALTGQQEDQEATEHGGSE